MSQSEPTIGPDWALPFVDQSAFEREQARLEGIWTFLGLAQDVASDGDWFRATIATRSVFVQRFGAELKGFENHCAHRFFPLRTADRGNGPVVCGFHHWRYDANGLAIGIPMGPELFGATPRDIGAALTPIDVATCGSFVFGRFRHGTSESLEEFLGDAFPLLEAISHMPQSPHRVTTTAQANWRLCMHITLDDYHTVAVHPTTFGKTGYPHRVAMGYFRFGLHSAFLSTPDPNALKTLLAACRDGSIRSSYYFIVQIFPNLVISHGRSDAQFWQILVQQYEPATHNRSNFRSFTYPSPFAADHAPHVRWTRRFTDPWRALAVRHVVGKVRNEDHAVCEAIQAVAHQIETPPTFGALEERVAWFEEALCQGHVRRIRRQRNAPIDRDGAGIRRGRTVIPPHVPAIWLFVESGLRPADIVLFGGRHSQAVPKDYEFHLCSRQHAVRNLRQG